MWWRKRNSRNKWKRESGRGRKKTYQSEMPLFVLYDGASKQMLLNGEMWLFDAFWHPASAHDSNTFTSSVFFLCPISFSMEVSRKTRGYNKLQRGEVGRVLQLCCRGRSGRRLQQSFRLTWTLRRGHRLRAKLWETGHFIPIYGIVSTITHQNVPESCSCK